MPVPVLAPTPALFEAVQAGPTTVVMIAGEHDKQVGQAKKTVSVVVTIPAVRVEFCTAVDDDRWVADE